MKQRGFTIVELLVVIIIMAILLTLAVVNVRSTQIQARDNERHTDVENIVTVLNSFHSSTHATLSGLQKSFPDTALLSNTYVTNYLKNHVGRGSLHSPGVDLEQPWSFVAATTFTTQAPYGSIPANLTTSNYVYAAYTNTAACDLSTPNTVCNNFAIFYRLESPTSDCPAPLNLCIVKEYRQ